MSALGAPHYSQQIAALLLAIMSKANVRYMRASAATQESCKVAAILTPFCVRDRGQWAYWQREWPRVGSGVGGFGRRICLLELFDPNPPAEIGRVFALERYIVENGNGGTYAVTMVSQECFPNLQQCWIKKTPSPNSGSVCFSSGKSGSWW